MAGDIKETLSIIGKFIGIVGGVLFIIIMIMFYQNYASVDLEDSLEAIKDIASCELDYRDYHYSGLCSDIGEQLTFLEGQYGVVE